MTRLKSANSQGGFTLIEVIIASALGLVVMVGLTSVVFTTWNATKTATDRIQTSAQIRNFEYFAYDDFASSGVPSSTSCGTSASPCTTDPLVLDGPRATNSFPPAMNPSRVTYTWDGSNFLDRQVEGSGSIIHAASGVTAFSWYVDANNTVLVALTVASGAYSESQTFRFYPRVQ
jgi:prepilin-type N-terminal cleavage/methylation domain-containing protein